MISLIIVQLKNTTDNQHFPVAVDCNSCTLEGCWQGDGHVSAPPAPPCQPAVEPSPAQAAELPPDQVLSPKQVLVLSVVADTVVVALAVLELSVLAELPLALLLPVVGDAVVVPRDFWACSPDL